MPEREIVISSPSASARFRSWVRTRRGRWILLIALASLAVVVASAVTYVRYARERSGDPTSTGGLGSLLPLKFQAGKQETLVPSRLDGTNVPIDRAERRPLAVMIENHPDARPQSGLDRASVVFEAITEGGITRFLALFGSQNAEKIGPIRSARPYFVEYAAGWKALYAHAGGSQGGLVLIGKTALVDLPHNQTAFRREPRPGVASEHTLFSATDKLYDYAQQKKASLTADFERWTFDSDPDTANRPTSQSVTIDFSSPSYKVGWSYDSGGDRYQRSLAGSAHKDAVSGAQLTAENVVVITVTRHNDPNTNQGKGEWTMDTSGEGRARLFKHGAQIDGTWKKANPGSMIRFFDGDGKEVSLGRGRTWIEVVPPDVGITVE